MSGAEEVATAFVAQSKAAMKRGNVSFDGMALKSYTTTIAVRYPHFMLVSDRYHSKSTQAHKRAVHTAARKAGMLVISVPYLSVLIDSSMHQHNVQNLKRALAYAKGRMEGYPGYEGYKLEVEAHQRALDEYTLRFELEATA